MELWEQLLTIVGSAVGGGGAVKLLDRYRSLRRQTRLDAEATQEFVNQQMAAVITKLQKHNDALDRQIDVLTEKLFQLRLRLEDPEHGN